MDLCCHNPQLNNNQSANQQLKLQSSEIPEQSISDERNSVDSTQQSIPEQEKDFEREDGDEPQTLEETDYRSPLLAKPRVPVMNAQDKTVRDVVGYYKIPEPKNPSESLDPNNREHDHDVDILTGDYHFHVQEKQNRNFLDANKVQIGTSILGPHDSSKSSEVAQYRIKFFNNFKYRPIILVTTVPDDESPMGPHADVFVASVSEVRLDSFIVSVVRVDQYPNNGWGQKLHLDWVAIEYATSSNFFEAGPPRPQQQPPSIANFVRATLLGMMSQRGMEQNDIELNGEVAQEEEQIE